MVMELIQGCKNKVELEKLQNELSIYEIVWPSQNSCNEALNLFTQYQYYLSHNVGLLDVLIGQTAVELGVPLYTFNQKHYQVVPHLQTIQPYQKTGTMPVDNMSESS
ncbi:PilT protein domain protein [Candidatus Thiomargarita nelsonii]|uniref:PilT protein domain protein n=1 Tax=Candidatus Thiomargarita nelsonii TaxID=1003181 RepID=A0A176RWU2_9GAMM|nr:PilT protein domain protein [Candidatus Thiomargarita nelsonii]